MQLHVGGLLPLPVTSILIELIAATAARRIQTMAFCVSLGVPSGVLEGNPVGATTNAIHRNMAPMMIADTMIDKLRRVCGFKNILLLTSLFFYGSGVI
jgi:hypothetical protein